MGCPNGNCDGSTRFNVNVVNKTMEVVKEPALNFRMNIPRSSEIVLLKKRVSIKQPLVLSKPLSGWHMPVSVRGKDIYVTGDTAQQVVENAIKLYESNKITIKPVVAWYNANLYWQGKVGKNLRMVPLSELQALNINGPINAKPMIDILGAKIWGMMQVYLAIEQEMYEPNFFRGLIGVVSRLLVSKNVGCNECAQHFAKAIEDLDAIVATRESARMFVFNTMNRINKERGRKILNYKEAKELNHWIDEDVSGN